ncbi:hypothetical protein EJ03DRAFT_145904 [Teratosphaeria nubilosa]|uniref:Uncharacterized protein n=1 Tax=Teratosphaeria nubilosa TaxID=161662 RepID=A0A6G1L453_9PEZI|nr:hypothetical protein EJ03DRAFT_145904 [Teratosphaeria nubilosa]
MFTGKYGLGPDHGFKKRTAWLSGLLGISKESACSRRVERDAELDCVHEVHQTPPGTSSHSCNNTSINATTPDTPNLISTRHISAQPLEMKSLLPTILLIAALATAQKGVFYSRCRCMSKSTKAHSKRKATGDPVNKRRKRLAKKRMEASQSLMRNKKCAWSQGLGGSWAKSGGRRVSITAIGGPGLEIAGSLPILKLLRLADVEDKHLLQ